MTSVSYTQVGVGTTNPNAQLDARYTTYVATTKDDRSLVGFLAAESGNSR